MMKKVFKKQDVANLMTEKVAEYFAQGYAIDFNHNSGSSGEKVKLALVKGDDHIMIRMDENYCLAIIDDGSSLGEHVRGLEVTVRRYECTYEDQIFWAGEGEVIESLKFYKLGRGWREQDAYTDDLDEIVEGRTKAFERMRARYLSSNDGIKPTAKIEKVLKNHRGYKRLKVDSVFKIYRVEPGYVIHFLPELEKKPIRVNF